MGRRKTVLGALTIGQSPRSDLIPEMLPLLGPDVEVIEAGALDGMSLEEVQGLYPGHQDYVLVTRMRDGTSVKIGQSHVFPRMQEKIKELEKQGADVIVLVCTGEFPPLESEKLLVKPDKVLFNVVKAVAEGLKLGVFIPDRDQIEHATRRWSRVSQHLQVEPASPYGSLDDIIVSAKNLRKADVQLAVLDCIGYTNWAKEKAKEILGVPVILARSIVARVLAELL
ncbi:MAG TPA: AroM family protein [Bacillota bacterium]|nr:AroM family protein [Bacillota bacterium]HQD73820.1 AroM family protein [Bacillota bacterium]